MEIREEGVAEAARGVDWQRVSAWPDLPREIMHRYKAYIHWDRAIPRLVNDLDLLDEFSASVDWNVVTKYPMLSIQLLERFYDRLIWEVFPYSNYLHDSAWLENDLFLASLSFLCTWDSDTVENYLSVELFRRMVDVAVDVETANLVCFSTLSHDILIEFQEYFDWNEVMLYHKFSEAELLQIWPKWTSNKSLSYTNTITLEPIIAMEEPPVGLIRKYLHEFSPSTWRLLRQYHPQLFSQLHRA